MVYNIYTKNGLREADMMCEETRHISVIFLVRLLEDLDRLAPPRK